MIHVGGYREYIEVFSTLEGYHDLCRGISCVHGGGGGVQYIRGISSMSHEYIGGIMIHVGVKIDTTL